MLFILFAIVVLPMLSPYNFYEMDREPAAHNLPPFAYSETQQADIAAGKLVFPHIFGTDSLGRDYYARVTYGTIISLIVGLAASVIVTAAGTVYGAAAGYFGKRADILMMGFLDAFYSLPSILAVILLSMAFDYRSPSGNVHGLVSSGIFGMILAFALVYWTEVARVVRARVITIKYSGYCLSAQAMGASKMYIIFHYIIPNCAGTIVVAAAGQIPLAIFIESALSFVGLGVKEPIPSLGYLANAAMPGIQTAPLHLIFSAAFIFLVILSCNLIAGGLKDAFNINSER
ncbi:MAG: ABC transporter permease [Oscillospiraceae bacterium]|nr:ABC transporter permease [Oscillospiraceae bacterium]